ncbi:Arm DNA-binding domain-containing protein [Cerasibacillus sp. JNUCC 74]
MAYINQDKSSWYFVVSNGKDPITNKPRQIKRRGFKTREEAELTALEVEPQIKRGEYFHGENMKFQALYEEWIESYPFTRKKSSTRNRKSSAKHLLSVWAQTDTYSQNFKSSVQAVYEFSSI